MALKISVYQPRVGLPVQPVVQETGETIAPGISSLAQGAGQAAQATMMKIKQIEISTQTEEGIIAQTAATNEFLDALKKNPIYPGVDSKTGMLPGYPDINPRREDGEFKDREELHAEVLAQYFADTDSGIQNAVLNPRARENIQNQFNRAKVQIADQVRDQMIADDLATLRQRNMDIFKQLQASGDYRAADRLASSMKLDGLISGAEEVAFYTQSRQIAAGLASREYAISALDDEWTANPEAALAKGLAAVNSQELADVMAERGLTSWYTDEAKQQTRGLIRQDYRDRVDAGMRLVAASSRDFRKRIHDIDENTNIPELRNAIIDDPSLSFFADKWTQQQRLLNLLDAKLAGGGSRPKFDPATIDDRLFEEMYREDTDADTIAISLYDIGNQILDEHRGSMSPKAFRALQIHTNQSIDYVLNEVKNREAIHSREGAYRAQSDKARKDALAQAKNEEDRVRINLNFDRLNDEIPREVNRLRSEGASPERTHQMTEAMFLAAAQGNIVIENSKDAFNVVSALYWGELGTAFRTGEDAEQTFTDLAFAFEETGRQQGVVLEPQARKLIDFTREVDGEVVSGQILAMPGEYQGERSWYVIDVGNSKNKRNIALGRWDETTREIVPHIIKSLPRENTNFSQEKNHDIEVNAIIDAMVGKADRSMLETQINSIPHSMSQAEIDAKVANRMVEVLSMKIDNAIEEYESLPSSFINRLKKRGIKRRFTRRNLEAGLAAQIKSDWIEYVLDELEAKYDLGSLFE